MFHQIYTFSMPFFKPSHFLVNQSMLYTQEKGYGFVTPQNRLEQEDLQIPEINSGFDPWYWLDGQDFMKLCSHPNGIYADKLNTSWMPEASIPLCFKVNVPCSGNYKVLITFQNIDDIPHSVLIFSGRRRLIFQLENLEPHTCITQTCFMNISDIIPRGRTIPMTDLSLDITLVGEQIVLTQIEIESCNVPTLYIGGDSTVTDQNTSYPYHPSYSYCGWGQMLSAFLNTQVAVSNHAHSGLTSETFRSEGHYKIIEEAIKPGDFFMFQFAHNDQKLPHLDADGGYSENLVRYIHEIKEKGATPILVTPLARNTWFADGSYNDLLSDYAKACKRTAEKENIFLIDLHELSMSFIKSIGLEKAKAYFFPKDYTHTNDYGGFYMAHLIADEIIRLKLPVISDFIQTSLLTSYSLKADKMLPIPLPPADYKDLSQMTFEVSFTDIEDSPFKKEIIHLTRLGIISNQESCFHPKIVTTRVEVLNWIIKTVGFVPMNVYNDYYPDVIGHEWYAGTVEVAHQNAIMPKQLTADGNFHPLEPVTTEEMLCFMLSSYQCRKQVPKKDMPISSTEMTTSTSDTLKLLTPYMLKIAQEIFDLSLDHLKQSITSILTKQDAAYYITKLYESLK